MSKIKVGLIISTVVVLLLAWKVAAELNLNHQLQSQVSELNSKLTNKSTQDNLELQGKCSKQAGATFIQLGYKNGGIDNYQSHYNPKLNKCFISIYSLANGATTNESLMDAYEQRVYGQYMWQPKADKKYWEVPPLLCMISSTSKEQTECKSEDEYKTFVARYMEE